MFGNVIPETFDTSREAMAQFNVSAVGTSFMIKNNKNMPLCTGTPLATGSFEFKAFEAIFLQHGFDVITPVRIYKIANLTCEKRFVEYAQKLTTQTGNVNHQSFQFHATKCENPAQVLAEGLRVSASPHKGIATTPNALSASRYGRQHRRTNGLFVTTVNAGVEYFADDDDRDICKIQTPPGFDSVVQTLDGETNYCVKHDAAIVITHYIEYVKSSEQAEPSMAAASAAAERDMQMTHGEALVRERQRQTAASSAPPPPPRGICLKEVVRSPGTLTTADMPFVYEKADKFPKGQLRGYPKSAVPKQSTGRRPPTSTPSRLSQEGRQPLYIPIFLDDYE